MADEDDELDRMEDYERFVKKYADTLVERDEVRHQRDRAEAIASERGEHLDRLEAERDALAAELARLRGELDDATASLAELAPHSLKAARDEAREVADRALAGLEYAEAERDALAARLTAAEKVVEAALALRSAYPQELTPRNSAQHLRDLVAAVDAYQATTSEEQG